MDYKSRDRVAASTHRYRQEYPPAGPFLSNSLANSARRASSETRLDVLHNQDFVRRMENKARIAMRRGEMEAMNEDERSEDWDGNGTDEVVDDGDVKSSLSEDEEALNVN